MSDLHIFLLLGGGLIALVVGGEFLVRGATGLAVAAKVSSLVIGLTVVAYGTSAPEMVVSIQAAFSGYANIAIANVVGSNIFNVLFILGICGLLAPLAVSSQLVRIDVPVMIVASLLVWFFSQNGSLQPWQGIILLAIIISYTLFIVKRSRHETKSVHAEYDASLKEEKAEVKEYPLWLSLAFVALGLLVLVFGARWLVDGAVSLARRFGVSETVIGLTIVAGGTSLPEVAASTVATLRGERDIAIGNIVGSSICNLLVILGVAPIVSGGLAVAPEILRVDLPVMTVAAAVCLPLFFLGFRFGRIEAFLFLLSYVAYTIFLILQAGQSAALDRYVWLLGHVALPAVLVAGFSLLYTKYKLAQKTAKSS